MAHRAKIALIGPRVSSKVAKRAVIPKLGVMMESRFDAENLPKIRLKESMVKPCWLLIEKQELASKETGTVAHKVHTIIVKAYWPLCLYTGRDIGLLNSLGRTLCLT